MCSFFSISKFLKGYSTICFVFSRFKGIVSFFQDKFKLIICQRYGCFTFFKELVHLKCSFYTFCFRSFFFVGERICVSLTIRVGDLFYNQGIVFFNHYNRSCDGFITVGNGFVRTFCFSDGIVECSCFVYSDVIKSNRTIFFVLSCSNNFIV